MRNIIIKAGPVEMKARLNHTATAGAIWENLPLHGRVNTWGEEIYFEIPIDMPPENAVETVEEGDLAYWPQGKCFCIFFGKTPISKGSEIKPASPVNLIGRLEGDFKKWAAVSSGEEITVFKE